MAELNTAEGGSKKKHGGKKRSKKVSTKVDLTPMVDLAFLLITFFMLTTTLNKPNAMQLNIPKKPDKPEEQAHINKELLLNIILDKDNIVWYYEGELADLQSNPSLLKQTTFSNENGIRDVIYDKQKRLETSYGDKDTMICIIKSTDEAKYGNVVDALDEMEITDVGRYALQSALEPELVVIKSKEQ